MPPVQRPTAPSRSCRSLIEQLPAERRTTRRCVVSVGRMHRVKGMATLVEAWAAGSLRDRANLLIIGGDLDRPSLDEREQLDLIAAVVPQRPAPPRGSDPCRAPAERCRGAVAGRRAIRAARPHGARRRVRVCERERGVRNRAARGHGDRPDGRRARRRRPGDLRPGRCDRSARRRPGTPYALEHGVATALDTAGPPDGERAERAHEMVRASFTIQAMASALGPVYRGVAAEEAELIRAAGVAL